MKTKILVVLLCLAFIQARAEVVKPFTAQPTLLSAQILPADQDPAQPKCILTWIVLGIFCIGLYACYWNGLHSDHDMTNKPPVVPPTPPPTNTVPTNIQPVALFALSASNAFTYFEVGTNGWTDPMGSVYEIARKTVLESSHDLRQWGKELTVRTWYSDVGTLTLVEDKDGKPLWTNYLIRADDGGATNQAPAWLIDFASERKFFRCAP